MLLTICCNAVDGLVVFADLYGEAQSGGLEVAGLGDQERLGPVPRETFLEVVNNFPDRTVFTSRGTERLAHINNKTTLLSPMPTAREWANAHCTRMPTARE